MKSGGKLSKKSPFLDVCRVFHGPWQRKGTARIVIWGLSEPPPEMTLWWHWVGVKAPSQPRKTLTAICTARRGFAFAAGYFPAPPLGMLRGEQAGLREGAVARKPHGCQKKPLGKASRGNQQASALTHLQLCGILTLWKLLH